MTIDDVLHDSVDLIHVLVLALQAGQDKHPSHVKDGWTVFVQGQDKGYTVK